MKDDVPAKPPDSAVREAYGPAGLTLSWRDGRRGPGHWLAVLLLAGMIVGPAVALTMSVLQNAQGQPAPPARGQPGLPFMLVAAIPFSFWGVVLGRALWEMVRPQRPAVVVLEPDMFQYTAGVRSAVYAGPKAARQDMPQIPSGAELFRALLGRRRPVRVDRAALTGFRLDRVGNQHRLYFDAGADRKELGPHLGDADRVWLHAVLEHWRTGGRRPEPQEVAAAEKPTTNKPAGSEIGEALGPAGLTLTVRPAPNAALRVLATVQMAVPLGFFALLWVVVVVTAVDSGQPLVVVILLPLTAALAVFGRTFWLLLRAGRAETVTLGPETFEYEPGASPLVDQFFWWSRRRVMWPAAVGVGYFRELFRRRPVVRVSRPALAGFVLDRVGERQRLSFEVDSKRVEIGVALREPDREWLHGVLERWRVVQPTA